MRAGRFSTKSPTAQVRMINVSGIFKQISGRKSATGVGSSQYFLAFCPGFLLEYSESLVGLMDTFEIGDKVVYPNHGVGIIEKISNRLVAGKFERFYLLRICSNDILVMVPTANASDVGLRKI